ncbi:DNA polymerase III subunit beta [Candidatus Karelsulcia muelleri]
MNFVIDSQYLLKHLKSIYSVISKRKNMNILTCFMLKINNGCLNIQASDLYLCIQMTLKVVSITTSHGSHVKNVKAAVPAKLLIEVLKQLPEQPITIQKINDNQIRLSFVKGNYDIGVLDHKLFPKANKINTPKSCSIQKETMLNIINNTLFAVGKEELRPVLNGVCFNINKQQGSFVATNAKILAKYCIHNINNKDKMNFIVPKQTLIILHKTLIHNLKEKTAIKIQYNKYNTSFQFSNTVIISSLIKGEFPHYEDIMKRYKLKNKLLIKGAYLIQAIKRIQLFSNPKDNIIHFSLSLKQNIIYAEHHALTNKGFEELRGEYRGDNLDISFNYKDLMAGLSNLTCKEIEIKLKDQYTPAIIKPICSLNNEQILRLIIPLTA